MFFLQSPESSDYSSLTQKTKKLFSGDIKQKVWNLGTGPAVRGWGLKVASSEIRAIRSNLFMEGDPFLSGYFLLASPDGSSHATPTRVQNGGF